jgi:hypothetical protein
MGGDHANLTPRLPLLTPAPRSPSATFGSTATVSPTGRITLAPPPGQPPRPSHPPVADRWKPANTTYNGQFDRWSQFNAAKIAQFQYNRDAQWNTIQRQAFAAGGTWKNQTLTPQFRQWRHDVWDFRKNRAAEIWQHTQNLHGDLFDHHWWSTCWWRHRPIIIVNNIAPWWWWTPATWGDEVTFLGADMAPDPIPYDPDTNVYYNGDNYDVNGQSASSADDARARAFALANPPITEIPVPEASPEGQPQEWLPLGVWALTQQEEGDPILFFQMSLNRDGLVAGGYKSALSGEEQPIIGQVDKRTQRIAWHVANSPQTAFETGLHNLDYDVASTFVHFAGPPGQTQTWLLVRLPSPEMPPAAVRTPNGVN